MDTALVPLFTDGQTLLLKGNFITFVTVFTFKVLTLVSNCRYYNFEQLDS